MIHSQLLSVKSFKILINYYLKVSVLQITEPNRKTNNTKPGKKQNEKKNHWMLWQFSFLSWI